MKEVAMRPLGLDLHRDGSRHPREDPKVADSSRVFPRGARMGSRTLALATMAVMHDIPPRSEDTSREAERVQVDLLRAAPVWRRLQVALSLSASVISAARRALARVEPGADRIESDIRFVDLHYGSALAAGLRADLERRRVSEATVPR
jgi:hypothetical protein